MHHLFFRQIKVGCYSGTTGLSHDEYVTIKDNTVVWSCGSRIIKSFKLNPSITPNTDIPMTLRSATPMNVDTPVNYFRDKQYSLHCNGNNNDDEQSTIFDKLSFVDDNFFDIESFLDGTINCNKLNSIQQQHASNGYNNKMMKNIFRTDNNENVNTDNCLNALTIKHHETDSDTTVHNDDDDDSAMSLEEEDEDAKQSLMIEQTPPSMIKQDKVLCDDYSDSMAMDVDLDQTQSRSINKPRMKRYHSTSGLSQHIHGINIKTPQREKQNQQQPIPIQSESADCAQILDVVWCYFPDFPSNEPQRCLCLLQNENITIISMTGDICYVPLPCETESIWALPEGLMIQAKQSYDMDEDEINDPILFSLLNPLEELRPIALHLLNANSKSLFFDEYYHKMGIKLASNADSNTSPSPNPTTIYTNKVLSFFVF